MGPVQDPDDHDIGLTQRISDVASEKATKNPLHKRSTVSCAACFSSPVVRSYRQRF